MAPPSMRLYTLLENLWGDQPGNWAVELGSELEPAATLTCDAFEHSEVCVRLRDGRWLSGEVDTAIAINSGK